MENRKFKKWSVIKNLSGGLPFCIIHAHGEACINAYAKKSPTAFSDDLSNEPVPISILIESCISYKNEYLAELDCQDNSNEGSRTDSKQEEQKEVQNYVKSIKGALSEYGILVIIRTVAEVSNWDKEYNDVFSLYTDFNIMKYDGVGYPLYVPRDFDETYLVLYKDKDQFVLVDKNWVTL